MCKGGGFHEQGAAGRRNPVQDLLWPLSSIGMEEHALIVPGCFMGERAMSDHEEEKGNEVVSHDEKMRLKIITEEQTATLSVAMQQTSGEESPFTVC
ncbi:MAG: hypothetical protein KF905_16495 [Flavobacteriales bacterium]|nr:hypothetical protein [Flavobacteriales bacterium]